MAKRKRKKKKDDLVLRIGGVYANGLNTRQILSFHRGKVRWRVLGVKDPKIESGECKRETFMRWVKAEVTELWPDEVTKVRGGRIN